MAKNLTPAHLRCIDDGKCPSIHELEDGRLLIVGKDGHAESIKLGIHGAMDERAIIIDRELLANLSPWQPISTAPKGNGPVADVYAPGYVEPPRILLRFGDEAIAIAYWDWYYAEGGHGCRDGFAWIGPECGEPLNLHYSTEPTHWQPLPLPPELIDRELLSGLDSALRTGEESKSGADVAEEAKGGF